MKKRVLYIALPLILAGLAFTQPFNNRFFEIAKNIEIFSNIYKEINTHYVDDLDPSKMMKIGIDAMLEALDPYTKYISEAEIENYRLATEGKYEGVGARIVNLGNELVVTDIYSGSPAEKSGMKIADRIIEVNGQSALGRKGRETMKFLRGAPGTTVNLKVDRPGENGPLSLEVERAEISKPSVPYSGKAGENIAYVSTRSFTPGCANDVVQAFKKIDGEGKIDGFILDLRGNGGGLLSEAVNMCNLFVPKNKLVVSTKAKVTDRNKNYNTRVEPFDTTRPLVVLIDKNSASASEIVSGTIQDYDRGVLMGQLSFGKGLVQNTKDVGYNSRVKITTSKYYIPSGRCIQAVEYDNGEPVRLPDSLRAQFTTKNGRTVLDGGGVKPDVSLEDLEDNELLAFLTKKGVIFNYVTEYILKNNVTELPEEWRFTDFDDFKIYFEGNRDEYTSSLQKPIRQLMKKLDGQESDPVLMAQVEKLESTLRLQEGKELVAQRDAIERLIAGEVVNRFDLDQGRSAYNLKVDPEIQAAVELLQNTERYNKILSGEG